MWFLILHMADRSSLSWFLRKSFLSPLKQLIVAGVSLADPEMNWNFSKVYSKAPVQNIALKAQENTKVSSFSVLLCPRTKNKKMLWAKCCSCLFTKKEIPPWAALFHRLFLSQFLTREAPRERSFSCCSISDVFLEKQCLATRKKSQKREHVSNSNLCNNGKALWCQGNKTAEKRIM